MKKVKTLNVLEKNGVVAVVRGNTKDIGINISNACINGDVKSIEVAYTNQFASDIIKALCKEHENRDDVIIGAGTVLDAETARLAILSGAKYIVSPSFNKETAILCNRYKVVYIPGVMTIKEIVEAHEIGVNIVKLFPGNVLGLGFIKSIKGPIPYANIMVTGGVNLDNIQDWINSGADYVGIGGELNKLGESGEFDKITDICKQYIYKFKKSKGE